MMATEFLLSAGATIFLYLLICNRIIALAHPLRMSTVALANSLCDDEGIPAAFADNVESAVSGMYSSSRAWLFVFAMPIAMAVGIYRHIVGGRDTTLDGIPVNKRPSAQLVITLTFVSTLVNCPLATILFAIQFLVFVILFLPVGSALRELLAISASTDTALESMLARHHMRHA
jgi:hypothetical protein